MALSTKFGVAASFFQTVGTFFYSKMACGIAFFDFFQKMIALSLYMASGFCWFMEALLEETDETDRWTHIKSRFNQVRLLSLEAPGMVWGFSAGVLTLVAGGLALIGLYVAAGPMFWTSFTITGVAAVCWFQSAQGNSAANRINQAAASFQFISTALFVGTAFLPPLLPLAVLLGLSSAVLWFSSYGVDQIIKPVVNDTLEVTEPESPPTSVKSVLIFSSKPTLSCAIIEPEDPNDPNDPNDLNHAHKDDTGPPPSPKTEKPKL